MPEPLIGITTSGRTETPPEKPYYDEFFSVPAPYVDAVRRGGGLPLLLPPVCPDWKPILARIDGVIVTGGADIDPARYNGDVYHPALTQLDPERDEAEIRLIGDLVATGGLPALCVCRGMQALNVALGGTLVEHVLDLRAEDLHGSGTGGWAAQTVDIRPDSLLVSVMGSEKVRTYCSHHQAVKTVAPGLAAVASTPDGIVEGLEMPGHPWLLGVQWHPEASAAADPTQQRLFDALVDAARRAS